MILLDLLFPRRCPVCDSVQPLGRVICPSCKDKLMVIGSPHCRKCGKPITDVRQEYCGDCQENLHFYKCGRAVYTYPCLRQAIYRFKYKGRYEYAQFFGTEMAKVLGTEIKSWNPDALIPVPLHRSKKRARGFNQAEALARVLGKQLEIPVNTSLIKRVKRTVPQKQLNRQLRQNNLKKAFKICRNDVKLSTIIIVDDIYTTGSTVDAMAQVLLDAGIKNIYFVALAIGRG